MPHEHRLQQRIQSADLTRTEKRIADYFLDHSESLYFMTARDIAQELGVSDTSIIRLCRTLGYSRDRVEKDLQKLTDDMCKEVDALLEKKEKELMAV